jgi:hypothetical protein
MLVENQRLKGEHEGNLLLVHLTSDEVMCAPELADFIGVLKANGVRHILASFSLSVPDRVEHTMFVCEQASLTSANPTDLRQAIAEWGPGFIGITVEAATDFEWQVAVSSLPN